MDFLDRVQKLWVALAMVGLVLPAMTAAEEGQPESALRERARAYWEALRSNDLHTIYRMEAATAKGQASPDQVPKNLVANSRLRVTGFHLRQVKVQGDRAEVIVDTELTLPDLEGKSFTGPTIREDWTFLNGQWYHGKPRTGLGSSASDENKQLPSRP